MTIVDHDAVAKDQLAAFVERIERVAEERGALAKDISEIYKEARGNGFDVKALKKIIALRRTDPSERAELEAIVDLYMNALGMTS